MATTQPPRPDKVPPGVGFRYLAGQLLHALRSESAVDIGHRGGIAALVGSSLAYGALLALAVSFVLPIPVAKRVLYLSLGVGPASALMLLYAWLVTRRHARGTEYKLARAGLWTVLCGPILWVALPLARGF